MTHRKTASVHDQHTTDTVNSKESMTNDDERNGPPADSLAVGASLAVCSRALKDEGRNHCALRPVIDMGVRACVVRACVCERQ